MLGAELHLEEGRFLLVRPGHGSELVRARRGIKTREEGQIGIANWAKRQPGFGRAPP